FLFPGVGYGGSCFPKDVQALHKTANEHEYEFKILNSVMNVNQIQKTVLSQKIKRYFGQDLAGKTIAVWGLAFKPNTDDIREAPALYIIDELLEAGVSIKAFDPEAMDNVKAIYGERITFVDNQYDALEGADALAIVTEWSVFRTPDFEKVKSLLKDDIVFDGRNLYDLDKMKKWGMHYESIGRATITKPVETSSNGQLS
ncbi:MAG: UDP binding domain-containing protein, partial [Bacteroidota bacterium]